MWNNLRDAFPEELKEMYQTLRSSGGLSYEDTERRFREHQAKWPEAIFNEDAYYKYLAPLFEKNNGSYLGMLQGSKAEQRKWWLYNRFRYIDSKYNAGDSLNDFITLRGYEKSDITVTPYADIYATIKYGSYLVHKRALRGGSYTLECPVDDLDDTEIYIYSASQLAELGDLSGLMVGYAEFAAGTKLSNLKLGDANVNYRNTNLTQLYLGSNVLLKTLDVRNCPNLGNVKADVNATPAIDLSGCTNIEEVYFDNTAITGCTLPNGGVMRKLHLPATVSNLTIRNQPRMSEFVMPSYENVTTLRLENVGSAVDGWRILVGMPENSRVRMIGFEWERDKVGDVLNMYDRLDSMRGLDENGNNANRAQMQGIVRTGGVTSALLADMKNRYPGIAVEYEFFGKSVSFYDDTGDKLLYVSVVNAGEDASYAGVLPVKEDTERYTYAFVGWSTTPGGDVDADAMNAVAEDRKVYAVFREATRKYTVRFYNGNVLLQTVMVPYGGSAVYTGNTPVYNEGGNSDKYEFLGFSPMGENITSDTDCFAQFRYLDYDYAKILGNGISGAYTNSLATSVGKYAVYGWNGLTEINLPAATMIDSYAFNYCNVLTKVNLPAATTIKDFAFNNCIALNTIDLGVATSADSAAFQYCTTLSTLVLRNTSQVFDLKSGQLARTKIYSGGSGYVYVPAALVDSYKSAANWGGLATQIRAIEDYPEIAGGES